MRAGATGALESRGLLISSFEGRPDREPTNSADVKKTGAPSCYPTTALLIRGSKPDPRRVRQAPQINRVRDDEARAFEPILEPTSSRAPHVSYSRANEGS
jgi:hypothetical protein